MTVRTATTAFLAAMLALPLAAADGAEGAPVALHDVAVTVEGDSVTVTGSTSFDVEVVAFEDDAGDSPFPGSDLGTGTIRQSDESEIAFSLTLASVPAEFPPTIAYVWPLDVDGTQLVAWPNSTRGSEPDWTYAVVFANGANSSDSEVGGTYEDGVITWLVPPASIGASGAFLGADEYGDPLPLDQVTTSVSVDSATWVISGHDLDTASNGTLFAVGGGARLVLRSADGAYTDEASTRVRRGVFSGSLNGLAPGSYVLEVIAEAGQDAVSQSFPITIG